jgi:hypothetical protein
MTESKARKSVSIFFLSSILLFGIMVGPIGAMSPFSFCCGILSQQVSYSNSNQKFNGSLDLNLLVDLFNFGGNLNYSRSESGIGSQNNDYLYAGIGFFHLLQVQYLSIGSLAIRSDIAFLSSELPFLPRKGRRNLWEYLTGMVMIDYNFPAKDFRVTIGIGAGIR